MAPRLSCALVSFFIGVACAAPVQREQRPSFLRRQKLTNEAAHTLTRTHPALVAQSASHRHVNVFNPGVPAAIMENPASSGYVDTQSAMGGIEGLSNSGAFVDEVSAPAAQVIPAQVVAQQQQLPPQMAMAAAQGGVAAPVSFSAQPTQEVVKMQAQAVAAGKKGEEYDDTNSDANDFMTNVDPDEPQETITREDIMETTANRQYQAQLKELQKQEVGTPQGALKETLEEKARSPPATMGVPTQQLVGSPSATGEVVVASARAALPGQQQQQMQMRPVASLVAAQQRQQFTAAAAAQQQQQQQRVAAAMEAQQMAEQRAAAATAAATMQQQQQRVAAQQMQQAQARGGQPTGVTRPKGWDQCLKFARFTKSQDVTGVELVRVWKSTCEPAVQSGAATERYRLMCNALGGAVEPYSAQLDYNVEALCDSVLAVFHDVTAVDAKAR